MCLQLLLIALKYDLHCAKHLATNFYALQKGGPLRDVMSSGIEKECHWWSGYDLSRRLLFFLVYLFCENFINDYTQVTT